MVFFYSTIQLIKWVMLLYFEHYVSIVLKKVEEAIADTEMKVFLIKLLKGYLQVVEEVIELLK